MKTVCITGASRGIGKATAIEFAKNHYNIILNYVQNDQKAIETKKEIENQYHVPILLIKADISKEQDAIKVIEQGIQTFGKIDVLINNAGIALDNEFYTKTEQEFKQVLQTNLLGPYFLSKHISKYMIKNKTGVIIQVGSTNGIDTYYPESIDYDASKAALISLTHNLAVQFAPFIRVNMVACGWVETEHNQTLDPTFKQQEIKKILLKRFAQPEEIAKTIYFLASNNASYINGAIIRIDGGY